MTLTRPRSVQVLLVPAFVACASSDDDAARTHVGDGADASIEASVPGDSPTEASPKSPLDGLDAARGLSSRCDAGVVCGSDAGTFTFRTSAAVCAELPDACAAGADGRTVMGDIIMRCMKEAGLSCTPSGSWFYVDSQGCLSSFSYFQDNEKNRVFGACALRFTESFRWPCLVGGSGFYYQSCTH